MYRRTGMMLAALSCCLLASACGGSSDSSSAPKPASLHEIEGTELKRIVLTPLGAKRVDLQTIPVREEAIEGSTVPRKVVPYTAVLYDADGQAWVYISPERLNFVRAPITIDDVKGDRVVLTDGPPVGTKVVTVGATELFGSEHEIRE